MICRFTSSVVGGCYYHTVPFRCTWERCPDTFGEWGAWRSVVDCLVHLHPEFPGCLVGEYPEGGRYVVPPITFLPPTGAVEIDWKGWAKSRRCTV